MSGLPWVRFFPSDWLGGSRGLSAAETGVYITLIAMMYERGEPLVEDHGRLARLCGASNSQFQKALAGLIEEGKILRVEGGLWNARVEKEQVYRSEKSEVGKQAAEKRWQKAKQKQRQGDANAMRGQCDGNANQKPEPEPESLDPKGSALPARDDEQAAVDIWNEMARSQSLPVVEKLTKERRSKLKARLAEVGGLPGWTHAVMRVANSDFCAGRKTDFRATIDFVLQASSFTKLNEGAYDNNPNKRGHDEQRNSHTQRRSRDDDLRSGVSDVFAAKRLRDPHRQDEQSDWSERFAHEGRRNEFSVRDVSFDRGEDGTFGDNTRRAAGYGSRGH